MFDDMGDARMEMEPMEAVHIRPLENRQELAACYDLWNEVFPNGRAFFQRRLDLDADYDLETTWVAIANGKIVSAAQVFAYDTWIADVQVKNAGIGNVATLKAYRGRGFARQILRQVGKWMTANQYDLSLLFTGSFSFYEQIGWERHLESVWTIGREPLTQHLLAVAPLAEIRPFADADLASVAALYDQFNLQRTGARVRSEAYWKGLAQWSYDESMVVEEQGKIAVYARFSRYPSDVLEIKELVYDIGHGQAAVSLVRSLLHAFPDVAEVRTRMPQEHALSAVFAQAGGERQAYDPMMWKVVDSASLLAKLRPILARRAAGLSLDRPMRVLWQVGDRDLLLTVAPAGVEAREATGAIAYEMRVKTSISEFVHLWLWGAATIGNPQLSENGLLRALFPEQPGILWSSDFF